MGAAVDGLEQGYSPSRQAGDPVPPRPLVAWPAPPRRPYKCPICLGTGTVGAGFYTQGQAVSTTPVTCRACSGRGVVIA